MQTFSINIMNTNFYFIVSNCCFPDWQEQIISWLSYVEKEWSRFHEHNELAKLNQLSKGGMIQLSVPLYDVLKKANDYFTRTGGLFSPYLKRQMEENGYTKSFPFTFSPSKRIEEKTIEAQPFIFLKDKIVLKNTIEEVDLGGFAKGYVVERIATWLKNFGKATFGLVDGGGDIRVWSDGEKEWTIGLAHPILEGKEIGAIRMKNGAVATSNRLYRSWTDGYKRKHHILNGISGEPAVTDIIQATVVTRNLLEGEVAAKMCFLLKEEKQDHWFRGKFPTCKRFIVKEGDCRVTSFD